jgi:SMODS-associating 2TM, beta-strand rich effector domain
MTHAYSTDSEERRFIPFFIAAAAIGAAFLAFYILDKYQIRLPWWGPPIDTMAFYGLFYWIFDHYIWKWSLTRRMGITKIPNLSGTWHGHVRPTETDGVSTGLGNEVDITLTIQQTWAHLLITGRTNLSKSRSLSGSLIVTDECSISYEYLNEPSAPAPGTMHAHRGTAMLSINETLKTLEGEYYSGRDRRSIGTIRLTRAKGA